MISIRLLRYGVAVGSVALALLLTLLLQPLLAPAVLPFFFLAVTVSAWYGGQEAGFLATFLSVLLSRYFLFPPLYSLWPIPGAAIVEFIVFSLVTILISMLELDLRVVHRKSRKHLFELKQVEATLQESNARFHAAAASSFDAIYILKSVRNKSGEIVDFQFVDLNEHGAKLISLTKPEVLNQKLCELLPANRTQGFFEKYKQVVETGIPLVEEFPSHMLPGVIAAWLHHQVIPLGDGLAITTRDITERKRAEEALKASEALYRTLAEAMPQLVWTQTAEGKVDYANQQWQQALGVMLEEVERSGWSHMVHPDDLPKLLAKEAVSLQVGEAREAEFRYRMADGSYRWFLGRCVPVKDDQGQVVKWVGTSTDIDDLKRYEVELARRKRRFKTLADHSPDIISRIDRDLRHRYVNPAITQATGLPPAAFIGKTHDDLDIPDHLKCYWQERLREVFATGQPCSYEFDFPAPDGTRHYLARMIPEFAPDGTVESILGITSDVTQFKQVEQSLRESEWRFRQVMESNLIALGFWSLTGEITEPNEALLNLLGYTRQEFLVEQPRWIDLTPPEYAEMDQQALEQIRQTGVCTPFEKEYIRKDGSRVPVLCGAAAFQSTSHKGVFFLLDLSDRKQVEKERERLLQLERAVRTEAETANRLKDEFLTVLSHELRTPLGPILGWAKLLQTRQFTPGMMNRALETIERNARQQTQLVEDLLDVSRMLQGKLVLTYCPVNLVEVIEGAIASVHLSAAAKSITLATYLDSTVPPVLGSQERLQQVIWNLLSNAIKFTPVDGQVTVYLELAGSSAQIRVTDTGKGIEASFVPYVFDYFRQADATITRSFGGLGLGLAISRHLVELHGGTISAFSTGLGQGATFTVCLPLAPDKRTSTVTALIPEVSEAVLAEKRILLAGEASDTQELIAVTLEKAGADVIVVTSIEAVLEELARDQPDLFIGTIDLFSANQYELMQRLRVWTQEFNEAIPVVTLISYPEEVNSQELLANGLQHLMSDSLEPNEFVERIAQIIHQTAKS